VAAVGRGVGAKNRPHSQPGQNLIFLGVHGAECPVGSIVEPAQVQHAVQGIQQQFVGQRNSPCPGRAPGNRHANHHLASGNAPALIAIDLEAQNIGWPAPAQKPPVEGGHFDPINQAQRKLR